VQQTLYNLFTALKSCKKIKMVKIRTLDDVKDRLCSCLTDIVIGCIQSIEVNQQKIGLLLREI